ncbi:ABC transporter substrate-binding protein [Tolumonas lignilytica]|jgi:ABC-type dipeptide transport system, periplasmic component|uniref:ABC transporter substrate-binding protein n=1 Tax=Tolumonas lignilytica TaxID=1283284 RepID=UPI0004666EBB|nr:ABC transporter substrate-binding protein [Tolumonas lignilytica]
MKTGMSKIAALMLAAGLCMPLYAANVKVALDADPESLDIHEQLSGGILQFSHMAFDPLVRFTKDMKFEGRLAESWEQLDPKTIRFHLRKGVKFHSGNPFTADDVVWTFNRLLKSEDFKGLFEVYQGMKKVDDYTVDLVAKVPYPLMLQNATYLFIMDSKFYTGKTADGKAKDEIVKAANTYAANHVSGTGPFKLVSREQGVKLVLERNKDYWDKKSPGNVDQLTIVPIKEDATRVAALLSGDVDMIAPVAPNDQNRVLSDKKLQMVTETSNRIVMFELNQNVVPQFKDQRVREAVNLAVNQKGIVEKIMKGFATPAGQMSPEGYLGYTKDLVPQYDLAKAKALMKAAGQEKGFEITMIATNNRYINDAKISEAVANMLSKINIKVTLKTMPKAQYWPEFDKCAAGMQLIGWQSDTEDSGNYFEYLVQTKDAKTGKGQYNCGGYSNPEVDKLIAESNAEVDVAKRTAMLQQIEKILVKDAAYLPLEWQNLSWAAKTNLNIKPIVNGLDFPYYGDLKVKE